jgi:hypothetical protein
MVVDLPGNRAVEDADCQVEGLAAELHLGAELAHQLDCLSAEGGQGERQLHLDTGLQVLPNQLVDLV